MVASWPSRGVPPTTVIPLRLFSNTNSSPATSLGLAAGFAMFGGLLLMPTMMAAMALSLGGSQVISRTGHYRALPIIGSALLAAACGCSPHRCLEMRNRGGSLGVSILGAIYASQVTQTLADAGVTGPPSDSTSGLHRWQPRDLPASPPPSPSSRSGCPGSSG